MALDKLNRALQKLAQMENRYTEVEQFLVDPDIITDQSRYQKLTKEFSDLMFPIEKYRKFRDYQRQSKELQEFIESGADDDFSELAQSERKDLQSRMKDLEPLLIDLAFPRTEERDQNLIFEIRAGTGGQEASLFAAVLFRMYSKYAEQKGWRVEVMSSHESEAGGFKEIIFGVSGPGASKLLKWESGVHRVQRVPVTEAQGRIHTSAATVAVLFEPEEIDVQIDPKDLKIDVFRSSGPGGQSVNTTDSAIRITHLSSGIVVICQDERSQLKNKNKAMRVLRARLLEKRTQESQDKESKDRKAKIGSGDRSEKIRTYNYSEHRVTDHRIGLTVYKLPAVLEGDLEDITQALVQAEEEIRVDERD